MTSAQYECSCMRFGLAWFVVSGRRRRQSILHEGAATDECFLIESFPYLPALHLDRLRAPPMVAAMSPLAALAYGARQTGRIIDSRRSSRLILPWRKVS